MSIPGVSLGRSKSNSAASLPFREFAAPKNTELNIKKADKNGKEQNFAVLCIHLESAARKGSAVRMLEQRALNGLPYSKACVSFMKFSKVGQKQKEKGATSRTRAVKARKGRVTSSPTCGGPVDCKAKLKSLCTFFTTSENGKSTVVGKGTVDPRVSYLCGTIVPHGFYIVRFSEFYDVTDEALDDDTRRVLESAKTQPITWHNNGVSRVRIRGELLDNSIGSGILVHDWPLQASDIANYLGRYVRRKKTRVQMWGFELPCNVQ